MQYTYQKFTLASRLDDEIRASSITIALDSVSTSGDETIVTFKAAISNEEKDTLDALVAAHDSTPSLVQPTQEVTTQLEKDDKGLRTWCAFATTNESGLAEICVPIPPPHRYIAYGDAEFETRHIGDHVSQIRVVDHNRLIAWGVALALDPEASEPVSDAFIQAMPSNQLPTGYALPHYPMVGAYEELKFPAEIFGNPPADPHVKGVVKPGMAMTLNYGLTESTPVGGYGKLPGGMYFVISAQKSADAPALDGHTGLAGYKLQVSIDWAEEEV